jgi:hypothetical protein
MRVNLDLTNGLVVSKAVMIGLAPFRGLAVELNSYGPDDPMRSLAATRHCGNQTFRR